MREFKVETFMSWENDYWEKNPETHQYEQKTIRAIALCDRHGYFVVAINCMRDGDMGEQGEDGVFERYWGGDYIYEDEYATLRPATGPEVALYLKHVPLHSGDPYERIVGKVKDRNGIHIVSVKRGKVMRNLLLLVQAVKFLPSRIRRKLQGGHW